MKIISFLMDNPLLTIIGATCLIQIVPIKINPWTALMKWAKKIMMNDVLTKINEIESKLDATNVDISNERVQRIRWNILNFTNSCRRGYEHTKEEWDHCIEELRWYEKYCEAKSISNGVIDQSAIWLRNRYHEHLNKDDFLKD